MVLVPTVRKDGKPYRTRFHRAWDKKVKEISGGLTVFQPVRGQWIHGSEDFNERMIPVQIATSRREMEEIVRMTVKYYGQIAVAWWKVSDDFNITYADDKLDAARA